MNLKFFCTVLLLFVQFNEYQSIIYKRTSRTIKRKEVGPTTFELYTTAVDVEYMNYNYYSVKGCDSVINIACDIGLRSQKYCMSNLKLSQKWSRSYNYVRGYISGANGRFRNVKDFDFPSNLDKHYRYEKLLIKFTDDFSFKHAYFADMVEISYSIDKMSLMRFVNMHPNITRDEFFESAGRYKHLHSITLLGVKLKTNCKKHYYGKTCWLKCVPSATKTCNCPAANKGSTQPCITKCPKNVVPTNVSIYVSTFRYVIVYCDVIDFCKTNNGKKCKDQCFQTANNTGVCGNMTLLVTSDLEKKKHLNSSIFFDKEMVTLQIQPNQSKVIRKNLFFTIPKKIFYITTGIIIIVKTKNQLSFQVNARTEADVPFNIDFSFHYPIWGRTYHRRKRIRVFVRPKNLNMYDVLNDKVLEGKIALGSIVYCNCTAVPNYYLLFFISFRQFYAKGVSGDTYQVPLDILTINSKAICKAFLYAPGRKLQAKTLTKTIKIVSHKSLYFIPKSNVIGKNEIIRCKSFTKTYKQLGMFQINGETNLHQSNGSYNLSNAYKGLYEIGCILKTKVLIRSLRLQFSVMSPLTELCFFIFPYTQGSLAQCSHNGYIYDHYTFEMLISFGSSDKYVKANSKFIRIPYDITTRYIKITCIVTNIFNSSISMNKSIDIALQIDTYGTYKYGESEKTCFRNDLYADSVSIYKLFRHSVILKQPVFICDFNFLSDSKLTASICFLILSVEVFLCLVLAVNSSGFKGLGTIEKTIIRVYRINRLRVFQELLLFKVKNYIAIKDHAGVKQSGQNIKDELYFNSFSSFSTLILNKHDK